jgi:hypothetical protein
MDQARKAVRPAGGGAAPELRAEWSTRTTRHEHDRAAVPQLATSTRLRARPPGWPAAPDVPAGPGARLLVAAPQQSPGKTPAGPPAGSGWWPDSRPGCLPKARSGSPPKATRAQQPGPTRPWCPPAAGSPAWRLDGTGSSSKHQGAAINRSASVRSATSLGCGRPGERRPRCRACRSGPRRMAARGRRPRSTLPGVARVGGRSPSRSKTWRASSLTRTRWLATSGTARRRRPAGRSPAAPAAAPPSGRAVPAAGRAGGCRARTPARGASGVLVCGSRSHSHGIAVAPATSVTTSTGCRLAQAQHGPTAGSPPGW